MERDHYCEELVVTTITSACIFTRPRSNDIASCMESSEEVQRTLSGEDSARLLFAHFAPIFHSPKTLIYERIINNNNKRIKQKRKK